MSIEQIQQIIGQLESGIDRIEPLLDEEDYKDYCDAQYTAITYWRILLKKAKRKEELNKQ